MKSLFLSYNTKAENAYIIRVKGHAESEAMAARCAKSCQGVEQPFTLWEAYNGIVGEIVAPSHHGEVMNLIKVTDHYMTRGEVACALSHISLWNRCLQIDQPIVVLEHDAVMVKAYKEHAVYHSICYLGNREQVQGGWPVLPTPTHASEGPNYHFICRAHAYAIDPAVAKNLLAHVIKYGINAPLDIMIRADIFPIHQMGIYAYDDRQETTILGRPTEGRSTLRNDTLTQ